jgi:hypothetical protein
LQFAMLHDGLHVHIPSKTDKVFVNTVSENKEGYTKRQLKEAAQVWELYAKLMYPSLKDFKWAVMSKQISMDCSVIVVEIIDLAQLVWGREISALKGKMVKKKLSPVHGSDLKVPKDLLKLHKVITMPIDIFFVAGIIFLLTLSQKINFMSATHLEICKIKTIARSFCEVFVYYYKRGFCITTVLADGKFAPLKQLIMSKPHAPTVNLTSQNEHVPEIECRVRVIKERAQAVQHSLVFKALPRLMTIHLTLHGVKQVVYFPTKAGISKTLSP